MRKARPFRPLPNTPSPRIASATLSTAISRHRPADEMLTLLRQSFRTQVEREVHQAKAEGRKPNFAEVRCEALKFDGMKNYVETLIQEAINYAASSGKSPWGTPRTNLTPKDGESFPRLAS